MKKKSHSELTFWTVRVAVAPGRVVEPDDVTGLVKFGGAPGLDVDPSLDAAGVDLAAKGEREDALRPLHRRALCK